MGLEAKYVYIYMYYTVSMVYIPTSHFFENNLLVKIVAMKLGSANTVWC